MSYLKKELHKLAAKKKDFKQLKIRGGANALLGGGVENEKPSSTLSNAKKIREN